MNMKASSRLFQLLLLLMYTFELKDELCFQQSRKMEEVNLIFNIHRSSPNFY